MPKQPDTKRTDPNRRMQTPNTNFTGLKQGVKFQQPKFVPTDPGLLKDKSTASKMTAGKTDWKPAGTAVGTSLANILKGTMEAAAVGVTGYMMGEKIEKQKEAEERAKEAKIDKIKRDREEADNEKRLQMNATIAEMEADEGWVELSAAEQNARVSAELAKYEFDTEKYTNLHRIDLAKNRSKAPGATYDTFINLTMEAINAVHAGPERDTEVGAETIGIILDQMDQNAQEMFKDQPEYIQKWRAYIADARGDLDKNEKRLGERAFSTARDAISEAHKTGLELTAQGRRWGSMDEYSEWVRETANVDFPDPNGNVSRHFADKWKSQIREDWLRIEQQQKERTIDMAAIEVEAAIGDYALLDANHDISFEDMHTLDAARAALIQAGAPIERVHRASADILVTFVDEMSRRLDPHFRTDEERKERARELMLVKLDEYGLNVDTPSARANRNKVLAEFQKAEFNALARFAADGNYVGLVELAALGTGRQQAAAFNVASEEAGIKFSPAAGFEMGMAMLDVNDDLAQLPLGRFIGLNDTRREALTKASEVAFMRAVRGDDISIEEAFKEAAVANGISEDNEFLLDYGFRLFQDTEGFRVASLRGRLEAEKEEDRIGVADFFRGLDGYFTKKGGTIDRRSGKVGDLTLQTEQQMAVKKLEKPRFVQARAQEVAARVYPRGVPRPGDESIEEFKQSVPEVMDAIEQDPVFMQAFTEAGTVDARRTLLKNVFEGVYNRSPSSEVLDMVARGMIEGASEEEKTFLGRIGDVWYAEIRREDRGTIYGKHHGDLQWFYDATVGTGMFDPNLQLTPSSIESWAAKNGLVVDFENKTIEENTEVSYQSNVAYFDTGPTRDNQPLPENVNVSSEFRRSVAEVAPELGAAYFLPNAEGEVDRSATARDGAVMQVMLETLANENTTHMVFQKNTNIPRLSEIEDGPEAYEKIKQLVLRDGANLEAGRFQVVMALIENGLKPISEYTPREVDAYVAKLKRDRNGNLYSRGGRLNGVELPDLYVPVEFSTPYGGPHQLPPSWYVAPEDPEETERTWGDFAIAPGN